MQFEGTAFPPKSSERHQAKLNVAQANSLSLIVADNIFSCDQQHAEVTAPIGNLPVRFKLPNGWVFVTERTDEVSQWLELNKRSSFIDKIESNWSAWCLSTMACIAVVLVGYYYVLPWVSDKVAYAIPDSVSVVLGEQVLESLDHRWEPSALSKAEQDAIRSRIEKHLTQLEVFPYQVDIVFRSSELGANAFALPGGKIILLDQLVALSNSQQQLDSIILHELGHIHHHHMLKRLVYSSVLSVGVALLTGESSGIVDNLAGASVFVLSSGYSREAEIQADAFAREAMTKIYGSTKPMAEMFELFRSQGYEELPEWLSSHPDLDKRIEAAKGN